MRKDVLTREQLLEQKTRRENTLRKMQAENAPPAAIAEAKKKLKLTELRLEKTEQPAG